MLAAARALLSYGKQDYATGIRAVPRVRKKVVDGGWWAGVNRVCFVSGWRKKIALSLSRTSLQLSHLQQQPTAGFTCEPGCRSDKVITLPEASTASANGLTSAVNPVNRRAW